MTSFTICIEIDDYEEDEIDMDQVREWVTGEINAVVNSLAIDTGVDVDWNFLED